MGWRVEHLQSPTRSPARTVLNSIIIASNTQSFFPLTHLFDL
jgi:hypothetical protein